MSEAKEIPGAIGAVEEIPESMFDPNVVRAAAIRQLKEMEDRHNFNRRVWYLRAVENWKLNHGRAIGQKAKPGAPEIPQPPLMLHYEWVESTTPDPKGNFSNEPIVTEGPGLVAEPYIPPVVDPDAPPEGVVAFGPPVEDGTGSFLVAVINTVPPGTHASRAGVEYVLVQLGRIGTLRYKKIWIPVRSEE